MAISWDTQVSNVNVEAKRASVTFVRTDDATGDVWMKSYGSVPLETSDQRLAILETVWASWQTELADRGQISDFLENLEQMANSNLDAREV